MRTRHGLWLIAICLQPLAMTVACGGHSAAPPRPNVLLITIDTFRADRIGIGVAPTIDRLAASGIRFTAARTAVPLTLPSHATVHTGLLPPAHGVRENGAATLSTSHQTIASLLKGAGYETAAFVGAFVLDHRFGLAQGFDVYDDRIPRDPNATDRLEAERPASAVVDRALAWLGAHQVVDEAASSSDQRAQNRRAPAPFFLWIHLYDPHAPYQPPPEFLARTKSPYDGEIAYADSQIARVLDALRGRGLLDRTIVAVAGDHGEGLGDHGERTHGMLVYDSTLRVPLVIAAPGRAAATRDEPVSLVDLAPTLLHAAGVAPAAEMRGRDLLQNVRLQPDQDLYSETEYPRVAGWTPLQALTDGRWMTIRAGSATEVYDLQHDPQEEHNLFASQATIGNAMAARAEVIHSRAAASASRATSSEVQERLRSLGYVTSSAQTAPAADAPNPAQRIASWNDFEDALSALANHRPAAEARLQRLAATNQDAPVIQTTYARALKDNGHFDAALAVYRHAATRWPTDAVLLHDLAVTARDAAGAATGARRRARHDEAARANQAALTLDPNSAPALNSIGLLAIDDGNTDAAVKAFERAAALDSNNASYWTNLGNARRGAGDRTGAEQAYRRALDVDAAAADAANGLGVLLVEASRPADAAPWFERAIAAGPDVVEARLNLGIALQTMGRVDGAAEQYRLVLKARGADARQKAAAGKLLTALGVAR